MKLKLYVLFLFFFNFFCPNIFSQNLFDTKHSLEFTDFLFKTQQYKFASIELERLIFYDKKNDTLKFMLLKSYRLSQNFTKGIARAEIFYPDFNSAPQLIAPEYFKLLATSENLIKSRKFLSENKKLSNSDFVIFSIHLNILEKNWNEAQNIFNNNKIEFPKTQKYKSIIYEGVHFKRKSPFLAGSLSVLFPGAGKIYTAWYKDAFFAFLSIAISSWQAYKGFSTDGINSTFGWTFGTISAIFYLSNIYGSVKSAKQYNSNYENELIQRAKYIFEN